MAKHKILVIFGTRPEIIKLAPVIHTLSKYDKFEVFTLHTGQHIELANEMLQIFNITPTFNLNVMSYNQDLFSLTSKIISEVAQIIKNNTFNLTIVQGDTTSAFVGSLAAFYAKIPVAHVEAGLRTNCKYSPFPEEMNRRLVSKIADLHFAPTLLAKKNLLAEGIPEKAIEVTGNTVIDALLWALSLPYEPKSSVLKDIFQNNLKNKKLVLVTTHRRESFGEPHLRVFRALKDLIEKYKDLIILFPVHPNPNVKKQVSQILGNNEKIFLVEPLSYLDFIHAMKNSFIILTDSGGVQEEAPSLKKPVLVLRDVTERPEGLESKALKLVGTNPEMICEEVKKLITNTSYYEEMTKNPNPYGDGQASARIANSIASFLQMT